MDAANIFQLITNVVAISGVAFALYRLNKIEKPQSDADLASKYQKLASDAADNERKWRERFEKIEASMEEMQTAHDAEIAGIKAQHATEIAMIKAQLTEERAYSIAMDEWAAEVLDILKSLKLTTTKQKPERKHGIN